MPPLQLRRGCCLRSGVIPGQSPGHASWRCPFLCRLFRRHEMPPLQLRRGRWLQVFVAAPSHGAMSRAPAGVAAPWSRILYGGEDCLSVASSAALTFRDRGKGTRRATPGRPWFWVLLPKQKDRVVRGRNPASIPPRRAGPKPRKTPPLIRTDPGLCVCRSAGRLWR